MPQPVCLLLLTVCIILFTQHSTTISATAANNKPTLKFSKKVAVIFGHLISHHLSSKQKQY